MEYKTMNRKELAMKLDISISTLGRRMKKLNPAFLEYIKNRSLLFENEIHS
ncbi:helix-turn-helix domain-containing protein [Labilibaculum euxinus]